MSAKLISKFVDCHEQRNMSAYALDKFFHEEKIFGRGKKEKIKKFVSNANLRNVPCHTTEITFSKFNYFSLIANFKNDLIKAVKREKPSDSLVGVSGTLELNKLRTLYLFNSRVPDIPYSNKIFKSLVEKELPFFEKVYDTAFEYVKNNRPPEETKLFSNIFPKKTWTSNTRCFVSLYAGNRTEGVKSHRDWVSFCVVTVCLQGDKDENSALVITRNDSTILEVNGNKSLKVLMNEGDFVVYGRFFHHVPFCLRDSDRCTLNFFF